MLESLLEGEISPLISGLGKLYLSGPTNRGPNMGKQRMNLDKLDKDMDWESSTDSSPMEVDKKKKKKKRKKNKKK